MISFILESKNSEFIETAESWLPRGGGQRKWGDIGQRTYTFTYKMHKFWRPNKFF